MSRARDISYASLVLLTGCFIGFGVRQFAASKVRSAPTASSATVEDSSQMKRESGVADPQEGRFSQLVTALRETSTLAGRRELFEILAKVPAKEIPALIDRAKALPLKYRKELSAVLFERWMDLDSSAAEEWVRKMGRSLNCYETWARLAPREALDHLLATDNEAADTSLTSGVLDTLAGKDRRMRMDILTRYPDSPARRENIEEEFRKWSKSDAESALAWLAVLPDDRFRRALTEMALVNLAKSNPKMAIQRIQELIPGLEATALGNEFLSKFVNSVAQKDPTLAMELAGQLPAELSLFPLIAAGSAWACTDPVAALDWARENGVNPTQKFWTENMRTDSSIMRSAMISNPAETIEWLLALPAGSGRDAWLRDAFFVNPGKSNPDLLRKMFDGLSPEAQTRIAGAMGRNLIRSNEFPAMETWVSMFPDESIRARAIGGAVERIFDQIPSRAEAIAASLPAGPDRDQALSALASAKYYGSASIAASTALEIGDPIVRYDTLDELLTFWMRRDRSNAEAWLNEQSDLPKEWVTEWLAIKQDR